MSQMLTAAEWEKQRQLAMAAMPAVIVEVGLPKVLLPYQARTVWLLESACPVLFIEKSRRIGLTWGLAAYTVLRAGRQKSAGGMDVMYISYAREMTRDYTTPLLLGEGGQEEPLAPGKFIYARMQAKSGLPIRSGIARAGLWAYLFKMYTQRDWAIFSQTYGQPVRVGKFASGATDEDKRTLFRAVANIAGDMAAIIPDSMMIEFIESGNVGAGHSMYKERVEFLEIQVSKAVLGQTATTDAVTGGLGSGKEHGDVRSDIKSADAKTLAAVRAQPISG